MSSSPGIAAEYPLVTDDFIRDFHRLLLQAVRDLEQPATLSPTPRQIGMQREFVDILDLILDVLFNPSQEGPALAHFTTEEEAENYLALLRRPHRRLSFDLNRFARDVLTVLEYAETWLVDLVGRYATSLPGISASQQEEITRRVEQCLDAAQPLRTRTAEIVVNQLATRASDVVDRLAETEEHVNDVRRNVEEAAGETATASLAEHFESHARQQAKVMWWLRGAATVLLAGAFFVAQAFVFSTEAPLTWDNEIARLALTLPILALAYYCLHEAGHHRNASQAAREDAVRLKTVRAYTDEMPDTQKEELRLELGRRIFGASSLPSVADMDAKDAASLVGALTALLGVAKK